MKPNRIVLFAICLIIVMVMGCSATSETKRYTFIRGKCTFTMAVSEKWLVNQEDGEILEKNGKAKITIEAYRSPEGKGFNNFVNIQKEMLVAWGEQSGSDTKFLSEEETEVDNSTAVLIEYLAPNFVGGVEMKHLVVLFYKEDYYIIRCSTSKDLYGDYYDEFINIIKSFKME